MATTKVPPLRFSFAALSAEALSASADTETVTPAMLSRRKHLSKRRVHPALVGKSKPCEAPGCGGLCVPRVGEAEAAWAKRSTCCPACARRRTRVVVG